MTHPIRLPSQPRLRSRPLLRIQQTHTDINKIRPSVRMVKHRCAAFTTELAIDSLGAVVALQGAGAIIERCPVELQDVCFWNESPCLDVVARREATVAAGASAGQVLCAVVGEPPRAADFILFRRRWGAHDIAPRRTYTRRALIRARDFEAHALAAAVRVQVLRFAGGGARLQALVFPPLVELLADVHKLLPRIHIRKPIPDPTVLGILDVDMVIQPKQPLPLLARRTLKYSRANLLFGLFVLHIDVGAAVPAEEARQLLGNPVDLHRALDLELGAGG